MGHVHMHLPVYKRNPCFMQSTAHRIHPLLVNDVCLSGFFLQSCRPMLLYLAAHVLGMTAAHTCSFLFSCAPLCISVLSILTDELQVHPYNLAFFFCILEPGPLGPEVPLGPRRILVWRLHYKENLS